MKCDSAMRALAVILALGGACKRKVYTQLDPASETPEAQTQAASDARGEAATEGEPNQALVSTQVRLNGGEVPEWLSCKVTVYDQGSTRAARAKGSCANQLRCDTGDGDLEVHMRADNGPERTQRLETRSFRAGTQVVSVDFAWAIGRVRVKRQPAPEIDSCNLRLVDASGQLLDGDADGKWLVVPAGKVLGHYSCKDRRGAAFILAINTQVETGKETDLSAKITPPTIMDGARSETVVAAPTGSPRGPTSSEQFPITKDYKELADPKGTPAYIPTGSELAAPSGQELLPTTRENP